ncbi:MAG: carboxypeptidase-like regulatory domain-containing protein [bacterium]|nr:carboxypeptidase-like regulatory domain-containing protein [bacterium]
MENGKISQVFLKGVLAFSIFYFFTFIFLHPQSVFASETEGTIDVADKYAWGENIGWINFGCDGCDVEITDDGMTGYAWSAQYGWINLDPVNAGVDNDGEGTLSGHAWGSNIGWINFTGVTINTEGVFLGYATVDSNSSEINFNCANGLSCASADFKVATDWRPASSRSTDSGGGSSGSRPRPPAPLALPPIFPPVLPPITSPLTVIPPIGLTANIVDAITGLLANLFRRNDAPLPPLEVPEAAPRALLAAWNILPVREINLFVFAPLPYELRMLASKFPELGRTFKEVGIERFSDVPKLAGVDLNIPGLGYILNSTIKNLNSAQLAELGEIEGVKLNLPAISGEGGALSSSVGTGKIALIEGLPISRFSMDAKKNLPSEFVFARAAGELVDLNVALSVGESGRVIQRMSTLPGKTLKLVVKPLGSARSVTGYIFFTAATPKVVDNGVLRSSLSASALLSMEGLVEENASPVAAEKKLVLSTFEYQDADRDGVYTADVVMPIVPGEYEVVTMIEYFDPELGNRKMSMVTVIDPEGYVFEKNNGKETRIPSAVVSLYRLNMATKAYETWNASDYQQENPQITDMRGTYSFLVPQGTYYLEAIAPGYTTYVGKAFLVTEGDGVHQNIALKASGSIWDGLDWQTVLLIVVSLLLVYNLYRDILRDKLSSLSNLLNKNGKP